MDSATTTQLMFASCRGLRKAYIRTASGIGVNCFQDSLGIEDLTVEITGDGYFLRDEPMQGPRALRHIKFIAAEGSSYRLNRFTNSTEVFENTSLLESVTVYVRGTSGQLTQVPLPLFGASNRTFRNCTSLTYMPLLDVSGVNQCIEIFDGCVNIAGGIVDMYDALKVRCSGVGDHGMAFRNCGSNTTTGSAELAQIPSDWK
jgi:hypothetical protein